MDSAKLWQRHQRYLCRIPTIGLVLEVSRMRFDDGRLDRMTASMRQAFEAIDALRTRGRPLRQSLEQTKFSKY